MPPYEIICVEGDKNRLTQVISNLLNNVQNFTEKGVISILMENKRGDEEDNNKSQIEVTIKDTGVGISQDILPRLFSKFATCSPSTTGLELYIAKNIVEAHRGKMWAENNQDCKGASFHFTLPLVINSQKVQNNNNSNNNCRIVKDKGIFTKRQQRLNLV